MTLQSSVSRVIYRGDGNQKEFPIPFRFLKTGHIAVFSPEGIVSGTDYEVSGNIQGNGFSGGTVVFRNAPSGAVAILRMVPFVQESDYVPNGDVPAETLEGNLDYLTMQTQELLEAVGRCVKMPETSDLTPEEWMEAFKKTIEASKDAALDASVSASNSAASASSCLAVIATIMTELTGDPAWAEESKNVLQEIWEAKGAVEAAREVAIGDISNRADVAKAAVAESARQAQEAAEASIDNKLVDAETEINAKVSAAIGADSVFDAALTEAKDNLNSDVQAALDSAEAVASGYVQQAKDAVDEAIADWEAIRDQAVADGNKALEELAAAKLAALKDIGDKVTEAQASSDNALGYSNSALAAAQSAAGEAAKAEAARIAAEAAESNIGNVVNVSLTAHNASAEAHPNGIAKLANARNIFGHSFNGTADVEGWVYSDVGMVIGKTIKVNMTDGKFRVYFEEEDNPLGDVGSGEILTYDPATGVLNCVSFTGKAMIAADGNATASQTFVNNKLVRSLATFGYLNCNGVLMQWGLTQMVGQTHSVSFPATYPNDCVSIQTTIHGSDESGDLAVVGIESKTASGFVLRAPNATLKPAVMWLATGY